MIRTKDPIRAPWSKGNSLSCSVFDGEGSLVATVYGRTREEQATRLKLIESAPEVVDMLKCLHDQIERDELGEYLPDAVLVCLKRLLQEVDQS